MHPQFRAEDFDYKEKKIIVIGCGSTAVTLILSLAKRASRVTKLQRSPSSILARPAVDGFAQWTLPDWLAHRIIRSNSSILSFLFVKFCTIDPLTTLKLIKNATLDQLPDNVPHDPHFSPRYNQWEQWLCLCPDGDFYGAMRACKASVVTETMTTVAETGIQLASGQTLETDIKVTATGLKLNITGGARISVDNVSLTISEKFLWKGAMLQDPRNLATVIGYTNASWTLGANAMALLVCRLLKTMTAKGTISTVSWVEDTKAMESASALNLSSTYVVRGAKELPKTGDKAPWLPRTSYFADLWITKFGNITDELHLYKVST